MKLMIPAWSNGAPIPETYAFGRIPDTGRFTISDNVSPELSWEGAPEETKSFALICHDPDVPSKPDNVNQEGKTVPKDLARTDFYHWVLVDIPAEVTRLPEGTGGRGVIARGKQVGCKAHGVTGLNSYTDWFKGDANMEGDYADYDGPCPPWNDERVHRYIFTLYALNCASLGLNGRFTGDQAFEALKKHVLASATYTGTYTMNRDL